MLSAGAAAIGSGFGTRRSFADSDAEELRLTGEAGSRQPDRQRVPDTAVWAYDGTVPGPAIRVAQGKPVRIFVSNKLGEDTTVHWHGIRLPNAMDGVPGLTQPPIAPGKSFTYEFTAPDAGTFWYHPMQTRCNSLGAGSPAH